MASNFINSLLKIPASPILAGGRLLANAFGDEGTAQYMDDLLNLPGWNPLDEIAGPQPLPQRDDIMMFNDLNKKRGTSGIGPVTPDYYANTYLPQEYQPGEYNPWSDNSFGAVSNEQLNELKRNPYLYDLFFRSQ